jgi:aryl-alcohol dehydrogenase-like predicted oxidoreductase
MRTRSIERDVLPVAERYGMGTIVWSPLAQGLLTGRVRKGQPSALRRGGTFHAHLTDERRIDAIAPPGTDVGRLDMAYNPPAVVTPALRRRPVGERTAA